MRGPRRPVRTIFAWPAALAAATGAGLLAGLMGDGAWDWIAWGGLVLPTAVAIKAR